MFRPANHCVETLAKRIGHDFGCSSHSLLDQPRINEFAECIGDHQWIHGEVECARTQMPGGRTTAHGLLLLGLLPAAQYEFGVYPDDATNMLNYGYDKARFLANGRIIAPRLRRATLETIDCGHMFVLKRPADTARLVERFTAAHATAA
jgi:hypothetical protein